MCEGRFGGGAFLWPVPYENNLRRFDICQYVDSAHGGPPLTAFPPSVGSIHVESRNQAFPTTPLGKDCFTPRFPACGLHPPHLDDRADDALGRQQYRDDEEQADHQDRTFGVFTQKIVQVMDEARPDEGPMSVPNPPTTDQMTISPEWMTSICSVPMMPFLSSTNTPATEVKNPNRRVEYLVGVHAVSR